MGATGLKPYTISKGLNFVVECELHMRQDFLPKLQVLLENSPQQC
jgi:hypothetical protein